MPRQGASGDTRRVTVDILLTQHQSLSNESHRIKQETGEDVTVSSLLRAWLSLGESVYFKKAKKRKASA